MAKFQNIKVDVKVKEKLKTQVRNMMLMHHPDFEKFKRLSYGEIIDYIADYYLKEIF